MTNFYPKNLIGFLFLFLSLSVFAQGPGCPNVEATGDRVLTCSDPCTDLSATFLQTGETSEYSVSAIPYEPFDFRGTPNRVSVGIDDVWSNVIQLPFEFCFFDQSYTEVQIGSNGIISFNSHTSGGFCAYSLGSDEFIPGAVTHKNAIMLFHDINPLYGDNEIGWELLGEYPCRTLVVSFADVPYYNASNPNNSATSTFQMVLYETTNAIDFFVESKPNPHNHVSSPINGGRAVLGIHNQDGTQGYTPPGRNTGVWEATEEAWRFTPSGEPNWEFAWMDENYNVIGTDPTISVCEPGSYIAQATYYSCTGDIISDEATVIVTRDVDFEIDLGNDISQCGGEEVILDASPTPANPAATYTWFLDGVEIAGETGNELTVNPPPIGEYFIGTYSVDVTVGECTVSDSVEIEFKAQPIIENEPEDLIVCDDGTGEGVFDLTQNDSVVLGGQDATFTVTYFRTEAAAESGLGQINPANAYPIVGQTETIWVRVANAAGDCYVISSFQISLETLEIDLGEDISGCDREEITLNGDVGTPATYEWFLDGVLIPGETGSTLTVTLPAPGDYFMGTYMVEATAGGCEVSDSIEIEFRAQPIIETEPDDLTVCDDGTGSGIFDLTQNDDVVRGSQDATFVVTYYHSEQNAEDGEGEISPADAYAIVGDTETIWVRIANATDDCYAVASFVISLELLEVDLGEDISTCDREEIVLNAELDSSATYEWFLDGALIAGETGSTLTIPLPASDVYFIGTYSVEATSGECMATDSVEIEFMAQPIIASEPLDMSVCTVNPAPTYFDLTENNEVVLGSQNGTFVITYHTSSNAAEAGTPAIDNPAAHPINGMSETIWVRIANDTGDCYAVSSFELSVASAIATAPASPHYLCDENGDGQEEINLVSVFNTAVLNGQNPGNLNVTYHASQTDADSGENSFDQPYTVTASTTTIYVRVENRNDPTCYDTAEFDIVLEEPPLVNFNPEPLVVCDTDNDGFAWFNLHDADEDITMGDADLIVTYHPTLLDAQNNLNELTDPYENDDPYNDVVFVRVEGQGSSCYATIRLELIVRNSPILVEPTPMIACGDDFAIFNLPTKEEEMLGEMNPNHYNFYYFEDEMDAIAAGESALNAPDFSNAIGNPAAYTNVTNPQIIYVLAVGNDLNTTPYNGGEGCFDIVPLELIVHNFPVPIQPAPYELCDDIESGSDTDQISTFNLTSRNAEITGGNPILGVTWYETHADEQADNPILNPRAYQNREIPPAPLNPQTVVARVTNIYGCSATVTLTLVVNPLPVLAEPTPLELCDVNNNGFGDFDLTLKDAEITNGETNVVIRYYTTRERAEIGNPGNQITGPYTNDNAYYDAVWARVEKTRTGCYAVVKLELIVNPVPAAPVEGFGDLMVCNDGGGSAEFDLTVNTPFVYGDQSPDFNISFHTSLADAEANEDPILDPENFTSSGQTIWVRLEDNETGCERISSFELIVGEMPVIVDPEDMELCDDFESGSNTDEISIFNLTLNNPIITDGDTSLRVYYYETLADQQNDEPIQNPSAYSNPVDANGIGITPYTLYVNVVNDDGCTATTQLTLVVLPVPRAIEPTPLILCDFNDDGFAEFDLTLKDAEIIDGENNVTIAYYPTRASAEAGDPAEEITGPYTNTVPYNDSVWARVEKTTTGCYVVIELELIVGPLPDAPVAGFGDLTSCDLGGSSAEFDLTLNEDYVYGTQSRDFLISYHRSEADAEGNIDPIQDPETYPSSGETIWVRLENNLTGCVRISSFDLIIGVLPEVFTPEPYELCDDIASGSTTDEISTFNLVSRNAEITGGDTTLSVTWFETQEDIDTNTPIANPRAYQNTVNPQTVFARVSNLGGCSVVIRLTLIVNPLPEIVDPTPLEVCDDDNDGFAEFDLTQKDNEIRGEETNISIRYYTTRERAEIGDPANQIVGLYTNDNAFQDYVWARGENETTGCFSIVRLELIVNPIPDAPIEGFGDLMACNDGGTTGLFDLTENSPYVYGSQSSDFVLTFHVSESDAENDINPIMEPDNFSSAGQTIWVRLENDITGCARISSFELIVGEMPTIFEPEDMVLCDDFESGSDTDGVSIFNLTLNNGTITGGNTALQVYYYETEEDQENDDPISNPEAYSNPVDGNGEGITPYTLFVSVYNETGCYATTTLNLVVLPVPRAAEPTPLVYCDDDNDGYGVFILTDKDEEIANGNPGVVVTYHETEIDAENGLFALASPFENIVRYSQTIYARATFAQAPNDSGCFVIVPLELIVSPAPVVPIELPDLVECDPDGSGVAVFDLTQQAPLIYGDQDEMDFVLTYHLDQADADNGENAITNPSQYSNISNPQEIYVRLAYATGDECYSTGHFTLIVGAEVTINTPTPLEVCDDLGEPGDMRATFDLTVKNAEITGGVPGVGVSYFLTQQDAEDNVNRIDPEDAFENTENPQRVYVRVDDGNSECVAYTSLLLRVLSNPQPVAPRPLELCDVTIVDGPGPDDGVEIFDLTERETEILNGGNWDLSYYESYDDAVTETDVIPDPTNYANTSNPQIIYVRVSNGNSGCFEIVELELIVHDLPLDTAEISPYILCEVNNDGRGVFDLTTKIPEILGDQVEEDFTVKFYLDPEDAANGVNAIQNPRTHVNQDWNGNTVNPQTIYTGIAHVDADCEVGGLQSFELFVQEGALATAPAEPFAICDNLGENDGIAEFDLDDFSSQAVVDLREEILSGQDPAAYSLYFYETLESANMGEEPIVFPYTNTINPQVIYARVTNDMNLYEPKCFEVVEVILKVEELPLITFDEEYRLCLDENGNPIAEESGASSPPVIDTYLDPEEYTFEWMLDGVLIPGENGPSVIATQPGEYTVILSEMATGCETFGVAVVYASAPPSSYSADVTSMAFSDNHTITVVAEGIGTYEFQLDNGPFQDGSVFENVEPGTHTVTIRDANGCGSVVLEVGIVDYPLYFTPNGDGYHDTWNITGLEVADPSAKIYIFDRYGKLLKQLSPMGPGWDGTYNGNPMPSSDYWFRVEYTENGTGKQMKGHFTLKR